MYGIYLLIFVAACDDGLKGDDTGASTPLVSESDCTGEELPAEEGRLYFTICDFVTTCQDGMIVSSWQDDRMAETFTILVAAGCFSPHGEICRDYDPPVSYEVDEDREVAKFILDCNGYAALRYTATWETDVGGD